MYPPINYCQAFDPGTRSYFWERPDNYAELQRHATLGYCELAELRRSVQAGARMLDIYYWNWQRLIPVDGLDMVHADSCVLGWCFGDFDKGLHKLKLHEGDAIMYGFQMESPLVSVDPTDRHAWAAACWKDDLKAEVWRQMWIREVAKRRQIELQRKARMVRAIARPRQEAHA